jgi:hypothetical protein
VGRFIDAPKALLPLWLLVAIVLAATFAGSAMADAAVSGWAGAIVAALVSWPAAMAARRELAKRGRTGFEELPSADWDYNDSPGVQAVTEIANTVVWFGGGAAAGALASAAGAGTGDGDLWGIPAWLLCGFVAAAPAMSESDARIGLWVRTRRVEDEERIEGEAGDADEPVPLADHPAPPTAADGSVVVPLKRRSALLWGIGSLAGGIACLLIALLADDVSGVERVILLVAAPGFTIAAFGWVRQVRAPYFLRVTPTGADLLGAGEVPWDAITFVSVATHSRTRWFGLSLAEPLGDQPWATARMKPLARRSDGAELEAMLRLSSWPAERVTAAARRVGDVDVEAFLA